MDVRAITNIMQSHLEKVKAEIERNMAEKGRNASMRSVKSLQVEVLPTQGIIWGLQSYWVMERGRKGGRVPYNFREMIRQWILDKGISVRRIPYKTNRLHKYTEEERSLRSAAGAIAHKIMTNGTRLHRTNGFDDIFSSAITRELEQMHEEMTSLVGLEIEKIQQL